jgi:hypothetical protein
MLAGMAGGEPQPIATLDRSLASLVAHFSTLGPLLGALFALCALAVLLPPRLAKPLYALAMLLAAITWIGQDFGGILTGRGTDPNSGPLLFLLALAYWPIRNQPTFAPAIVIPGRRFPLLRTGAAACAAALVAASSVAAATGLTTATANASAGPGPFSATTIHMLGPGPIQHRYQLAGYHILFQDRTNRATRPGVISVELRHGPRSVTNARITVTCRSLDMPMPTHTLHLHSRGHGRYSQRGPRLSMGGRWRLTISVLPRSQPALQLSLTDLVSL